MKAINNNKGLTKQGVYNLPWQHNTSEQRSKRSAHHGFSSVSVFCEPSTQKRYKVEQKTYLAADSPNRMPIVVISWP